MKNLYLFLLVFTIISLPVFGKDLSSVTQKYGVVSTQIYEQVLLQDTLREYKKICTKESISQGNLAFTSLKRKFNRSYIKMPDYKKLSFSKQTFETYQKKMADSLGTTTKQQCSNAIAWSSYMDFVRDKHVALIHSSGIIKDFQDINSKELHGSDIKIGLLQELVDRLQVYDASFPIAFTMSNEKLIANLDTKQKKVSDLLTLLLKRTIQKKLADLKHDGLLTEGDLQQFAGKIVLERTNSCSNFHGSYKIKEVYTSDGILLSQEVDQMKIVLNLCYNYHTLQDIGLLFEKMVTHEIGHHLYYQKDKTRAEFENICRSTTNTKKKDCKENSFVSSYAMTNSIEDYAEQFMHSYLKTSPSGDALVTKKNTYFQNMFAALKK